MLRIAALVCAIAAVRSCDVCVDGRCQQRKTIMHGFAVTDQMAIDRVGRVLYVQLESDLNVAYGFNESVIERVQNSSTSGLTVDQATNTLYTAEFKGDKKILYSYQPGEPVQEDSTGILNYEPDLMFYNHVLYYTAKCCKGLHYIKNWKRYHFLSLVNVKITDFVVTENKNIYYVSDSKVYVSNTSYNTPKLIAAKKYTLSVDSFGDVYLGDATLNAIYKLDESDKLVDYAAYSSGSVERFVFDHLGNIVFYDGTNNTVAYWMPTGSKCAIEPPHDKYIIRLQASG